MQFDAHCIDCLMHRQFRLAMAQGDGKTADAYLRRCMQIILEAPQGVAAPWLAGAFSQAFSQLYPGVDAYGQLKKDSNDLVLDLLPQIREMVDKAEDPLEMALKFARTGNFLDFGILTPEIAHQALWQAIDRTPEDGLDIPTYSSLVRSLETAKQLLILGDNAGEIVFDILLAEQLKKRFPALHISYCVRGGAVLNDATREDAAYVGMDKVCHVIDSGSCISGTELDFIGSELKQAIHAADVILSKGSGNFECLAGCGLPVYYIFMCKCQRVAKLLGVENMTGQFLRDADILPGSPYMGKI